MNTVGPSRFHHEALVYESDARLAEQVLRFVERGLTAEEPILVTLESSKLPLVQGVLGETDQVEFAAMEEVGRNPGRLISLWHDFVDRHGGPNRTVWGIGEPIYAARDPSELVECQIHERLLNPAFVDSPYEFWLGCPYDRSSLPAAVLVEMEHSHPQVGVGAKRQESAAFREGITGLTNLPLSPSVSSDHEVIPFTRSTLSALRRRVGDAARDSGVAASRIPDVVLSVHEVVVNSILYAGQGELVVWEDRNRFMCEVRDVGTIDNPLVGRRRPSPSGERGRGIWIAYQLSDLLQLRSDETGTKVRIGFQLS